VIRIDIDGGVAWLRRVAVIEELQRAGHGRILLAMAEDFARAEGCDEVRSNVDPGAVGFYERCGYSRESSNHSTSDSVPMLKPLV
jgi:GNAT superfamily N-acetyltransferase